MRNGLRANLPSLTPFFIRIPKFSEPRSFKGFTILGLNIVLLNYS